MNGIKDFKPILFLLTLVCFNTFYFGYVYDGLTLTLNVSAVLAILSFLLYIFFFVDNFCQIRKNPDNVPNKYMFFVLVCNLVFILSELFLRCFIGMSTIKVILNSLSLGLFTFFILQLFIIKHRKYILIFCLTLAIVNFLDVYSDGFLIKKIYEFIAYSGLMYRWSKDMSIDLEPMKNMIMDTNVDDIREFIRALILVSTSIIAVDRVWGLKANSDSASKKDKK